MTKIVDLITQLDIDALADDQLAESRAGAVRRHLLTNSGAMDYLATMDMVKSALTAAKSKLYQNTDLREALESLSNRRSLTVMAG